MRRKWEVYRVLPQDWYEKWDKPVESPYVQVFRYKTACRIAAEADWTLRNGRSDEEFAVFKVRRLK